MSLLTIVQEAADEIGVQRPTSVIGNTNDQVRQLLALCNREGKTLSARPYQGWQQLLFEATLTTLAQEDQGNINTIAPNHKYIVNNTMWNRSKQRIVYGSLNSQKWQSLKSTAAGQVFEEYRIRQNRLLLIPAPAAGETIVFEYLTKNWLEDTNGDGFTTWQNDTDTARLDEELITLGLIWRWKHAKGFNYAQDFAEYERQVNDAIARNGTKPDLSLNPSYSNDRAGVVVPETGFGA